MKRRFSLASVLVVLVLVGLVAVTASQGSSSDPLVTLSYLTDIFKPQVMSEVEQKLSDSEAAALAKVEETVKAYTGELAGLQGGEGLASAAFESVTVTQGQSLSVGSGCEVVLVSGAGSAVSPSSAGFIDSTSGGFLENGNAFAANHLYVAAADGRSFSATADSSLLVRGEYKIS